MTDEERVSLRDYIDQRFRDSERAVEAALGAAKEAVDKANSAAERRFESVNEFRSTLADQQRTLITRAEYEANHKNLMDRVAAVEAFRNEFLGRDQGTDQAVTRTMAAVAILVSFGLVVLDFFYGHH